MISLVLSGCSSSRSMASSFSISSPSTIASPEQSYHRRASFTNSFPTIRCQISDRRWVNSAAPPPKNQLLPITPVPVPVLYGLDTGTDTRLRIFSGTANPALSQKLADYLGLKLVKVKRKRFADGEFYVQLQECIRGCNVFLVQPIGLTENANLVQLLMMADLCRRASAKNVNAVIPYFGYPKTDIKIPRHSNAAQLAANYIDEAGVDHVLSCVRFGQSMTDLDMPIDHVCGQRVIIDYLASKTFCPNDLVVVCLSHDGVENARAFAKSLSDAVLVITDKKFQGHNAAEVMNLDGDVRGKVAIVLDDMIDSAGTISECAALLHKEGAREVYACCTHAVFSPLAIEKLSSGLFKEVITTDTIPILEENDFPQLTVLSVANLLGDAIWRVHDLFQP